MESTSKEENEAKEVIPITKFFNFSKVVNGFLKEWIESHYSQKRTVQSIFSLKQTLRLVFMSMCLIRSIKLIIITDNNNKLLIYFGSPFQYLGGNRFHNEFLLILWDINFILTHIFVIHSKTKQYKWLEIFAFLSGFLPFAKIGK